MFAADVAVEDQDEIAQDSSCMLGHSQGTFCRVAGFRIDTTAPAVGLSGVPQKTTKTTLQITMYQMDFICTSAVIPQALRRHIRTTTSSKRYGMLFPLL